MFCLEEEVELEGMRLRVEEEGGAVLQDGQPSSLAALAPFAQLISDALCLARLLDATLTGRCPAFQSTPCFMVAEKGKTVQAGIPK